MTTVNTDIDTIAAEDTPLTLESGFEVKVERLRTRATMSLLKILTRGAGAILSEIKVGADMDPVEFAGQLAGAVVLSIPEAEDETIEFINRMVSPAKLKEGKRLTEADLIHNAKLDEQLREELDDPSLEDLETILYEIITNEAPHILALGKRLAVLLKAQQANATAKQKASSKNASKG